MPRLFCKGGWMLQTVLLIRDARWFEKDFQNEDA